jgi:hypothetical protein
MASFLSDMSSSRGRGHTAFLVQSWALPDEVVAALGEVPPASMTPVLQQLVRARGLVLYASEGRRVN